jgi:radical SAM protein with 4Fe4S-binding SPASM domain
MLRSIKHYSVPHLVHIETTYLCNSKCIFCYNPSKVSSINYNRLDRIVSSVKKSHIPHVYLIGGEPSLLKIEKLNKYIDELSETSSVTIVTNGKIYLKNLSKKLACIGIPIHGDEKTHEYLTNSKGSYKKIIENIRRYVKDGFDVRCIPVLMSKNYNQMYNIINLAAELGMESVFIDKFESGGIGSKMTKKLSPSISQFKNSLTQVIQAKRDFNIPVGFGTAIPFCIDKRLLKENLQADCGVGTTFAAIDPLGNVRLCNQSQKVYGNVLNESIEKIWNKKELDEFRGLKWVTKPCNKCPLIYDCACGCKVDTNCPGEFCVDYAVRGFKKPLNKFQPTNSLIIKYPSEFRRFKVNSYLKINDFHNEDYIVTRYQTTEIDPSTKELIKFILKKDFILEKEFINRFQDRFSKKDLREFLSKLLLIGAIDLI